MDTFDAILSRRSIRSFLPNKVPDELLHRLLQAAMQAPSAGNAQPWHFIVINDPKILNEIPTIHPYAAMAREASHAILVCGVVSLERYPGYWVQDCAAATQNLLLAAHALGLGAVWTGIHPTAERTEKFKKTFHLPPHVIPFAFIPLGYPKQSPVPPIALIPKEFI